MMCVSGAELERRPHPMPYPRPIPSPYMVNYTPELKRWFDDNHYDDEDRQEFLEDMYNDFAD